MDLIHKRETSNWVLTFRDVVVYFAVQQLFHKRLFLNNVIHVLDSLSQI